MLAFGAKVLLIEDQSSGMELIQTSRNARPRGVPLPIACKSQDDKRERLAGVSAMIEAGQLHLPIEASWRADFLQEVLAFPNARHDDQVDALSQLLKWVDDQQRWDEPTFIGVGMICGPGTYDRYDL